MIAALMLAAVQAAAPVPPTPPAPPAAVAGDRTIVREVVVEKSKDGPERREILILHGGDAKSANGERRRIRIFERGGKPGETRETRILRNGDTPTGGERIVLDGCEGKSLVDIDEDRPAAVGKPGERTRVLVCAAAGGSDVAAVQRLRDAARRIEADPSLSSEAKNRVLLAINEAITRLPARE